MSADRRKRDLAAAGLIPVYIPQATASKVLSMFGAPGQSLSKIIEKILLERIGEAEAAHG